MTKLTKLAFYLCLALAASAVSRTAYAATINQQILARLDALERENAALRARVRRLETSRAAKIEHRAALAPRSLPPPPTLASSLPESRFHHALRSADRFCISSQAPAISNTGHW